MCVGVQLSMHVLKLNHFIFVGLDFLKVQEVKYLLMLNIWWILNLQELYFCEFWLLKVQEVEVCWYPIIDL